MGVYGTSSPSDQTFDLESYKDLIYAVYQFTESGKGVIPFISDVSSYYNVFTNLNGENVYDNNQTQTSSLTIPNLTVSSYENSRSSVKFVRDIQNEKRRIFLLLYK